MLIYIFIGIIIIFSLIFFPLLTISAFIYSFFHIKSMFIIIPMFGIAFLIDIIRFLKILSKLLREPGNYDEEFIKKVAVMNIVRDNRNK